MRVTARGAQKHLCQIVTGLSLWRLPPSTLKTLSARDGPFRNIALNVLLLATLKAEDSSLAIATVVETD